MVASITSLGIGSGIDANNIVSSLMKLERAPLDALNLREASYKAKISAFGTIKSKFDALKTAATVLSDPARLAAFTATAGDKDILSASTGTFAGAGSYNINITQLAQAQKSFSNSLYGASDTFAAGTLTFDIGGTAVDVAFAGGTLNDVRNAINAADIGISATAVTGDAGARLVLTSKSTGTDNTFSLSVTGGDANLASLATFDTLNPNARAAQNATVEVEGELITSQSNEISGVIPDVTINAKQVGATTLDIARSSSSALESVKTFVTAFNDAAKELRKLSAFDPSTKVAGVLNGDSTVRTLQSLLRNTINRPPAELTGTAFENLSALGISFQTDGTLALDESKLTNAIDTNFTAVTQSLNAFGTAVSTLADQVTRFDGLLTNRTDGLNATVSLMSTQRTRMEFQLTLREDRLRSQFTALDSLMGQLNTTSAFLTQQLASLTSSNS